MLTSIFVEEAKLQFPFKHPIVVKGCAKPVNCGFILKTTPAKDGGDMILCTAPSDYSDSDLHYHSEMQAGNMHVVVRGIFSGAGHYSPVSWSGRPRIINNTFCWDLNDTRVPDEMYIIVFIKQ